MIAFVGIAQTDYVGGGNVNASLAAPSVAGSNVVGIVFITIQNNSGLVAAPQWNGAPMTLVVTETDGQPASTYCYIIVAPTAGNVTVSRNSGSNSWNVTAMTYSGVNQSTTVDASNVGNGIGVTGTVVASVTSVASGCWAVLNTHNDGGGSTPSVGITQRGSVLSTVTINGDSNGPTTAGVPYTMTYTENFPNEDYSWVVISLAPPSSPVSSAGNFLAFM